MSFITDKHITNKFNFKKTDAEERGIPFEFTRKSFKYLWRTCDGTCDYTGMALTSETGFPNTATLERIDPRGAYAPSNVCIVRSDCNLLKSYCLEDKCTSSNITITKEQKTLIKKMCDTLYNKDKMESLKRKYLLQEETKVGEDSTLFYKPYIISEEVAPEAPQIATEDTTETFYDSEVAFAQHYITLATELKQCNQQLRISLGEMKKKFRSNKCALTGEKFSCLEDKYIFVLDLTAPITKSNIVLTTKTARDAMYTLVSKGGSLEKVSLNLHKLEQR